MFGSTKKAPFPEDVRKLGRDGIKQIWQEAKLRGRGYANAKTILEQAEKSVGIKDGYEAGKQAVQWFVKQIL